MQVKRLLLETRGVTRGLWARRPDALELVSQRRHAVEVKAGPPRAAVAFVLVHLRAVAVLVRALRRLVRVIIAYLLVLLLLFNADREKSEMRSQQLRNGRSQLSQVRTEIWGRHLQSLRRGLRGTAVTLVSGSITEGSVHLLLEDVRQGMQRDAAQRGWVVARVVTV